MPEFLQNSWKEIIGFVASGILYGLTYRGIQTMKSVASVTSERKKSQRVESLSQQENFRLPKPLVDNGIHEQTEPSLLHLHTYN